MIIVKWRHDGDYLAGAKASEGFEWTCSRLHAAKFDSIAQFRRFERVVLEVFYDKRGNREPWTKADVAFVRVR